MTRVSALITFVTLQHVRDQAPTTTLKFSLNPGRANRKIIDYETKAGKALYKRAPRPLYSGSKSKFALTSERLCLLVGILTGR